MRKTVMNLIGTLLIIVLVVAAGVGSYKNHNYTMTVKPASEFGVVPESLAEMEYIEIPPEEVEMLLELQRREAEMALIPKVPEIRWSSFDANALWLNLTFEEMDLLQQLAMAEARGEDSKGQALVMRVAINRAIKDGKSLEEVIFAPGQFYTVGMGHYVPNDANNEAIGMIIDGWDESEGALFFSADGYNGKEPLFQYGRHYFSK